MFEHKAFSETVRLRLGSIVNPLPLIARVCKYAVRSIREGQLTLIDKDELNWFDMLHKNLREHPQVLPTLENGG